MGLISVTAVLMITIFHGSDVGYSDLGGTRLFGIGMIMLWAISLYELLIIYRGSLNRQRIIHFNLLFINSFFLIRLFFGETPLSLSFGEQLLAVVALLINFAYMARESKLVKANALIGLLATCLLLLFTISWSIILNLFLAFFSFWILAIVSEYFYKDNDYKLATVIRRNIVKLNLGGKDEPLFLANFGILSFWAMLLSAFLTWVGINLSDSFASNFENLLLAYNGIDNFFSSFIEFLFGAGLTIYPVEGLSLLVSYGIIGFIAIGALFIYAFWDIVKTVNQGREGEKWHILAYYLLYVFALFVVASQLLVGRLDVLTQFLLLFSIILVYGLNSLKIRHWKKLSPSIKSEDKLTFKQITSVDVLTRLMPSRYWRFLFVNIRIILIIVILVSLPRLVEFVAELY
jgi:hypothetical protein